MHFRRIEVNTMNTLNKALVLLLPLCLASCVLSKRPLSDEATSVVDEAMIGQWLQVTESSQVNVNHLTIGRLSGSPNAMEWISTNILKDGTVDVNRMNAFTRPGAIRFLSVELESKDKKSGPAYMIGKYDMPDKDTFRWFLPSREFVGRAIERGELKGTVNYKDASKKTAEKPADKPREINSVMLDDTPERMVAFLEKHDGQCYEQPIVYTKSMITLRKLFKEEAAK